MTIAPQSQERPSMQPEPRSVVGLLAGATAVLGVAAAGFAPLPYAVMSPGPVRNVLGTSDVDGHETPMISIKERRTYPTSGSLDMLTISVSGGPGRRVTLPQVVAAWLSPHDSVQPVAAVFPPLQSPKQQEEQSAAAMTSSQENATAAAMNELGIKVPIRLRVEGFGLDSKAHSSLKVGDVLLAVNGRPVTSMTTLRSMVRAHAVGSQVKVTVRRAGKQVTVPVTLISSSQKQPALGIMIRALPSFPFPVKISIESVGGPSAGTMFALGIIDQLTPGALTGGKQVAGTGTIDPDGNVGGIGGIRQKMAAAREAGAGWFLAPASNCNEVAGRIPDGLQVIRVATLHEARTSVAKVAQGQTSGLPTCT